MSTIDIEVLGAVTDITAADWDSCAIGPDADRRPRDPFTTHGFLAALENSGSVGKGTGWVPRHLVARVSGQVVAVMPLYAKGHSQGEFVFDHQWAHAYENAGGRYYPKLQSAVPFTPVTGSRFLCRDGHTDNGQAALVEGAVRLAAENQLSSLHITFCTAQEADRGRDMGLLVRTGQQFHWVNDRYGSFDEFTAALSSRKRKAIIKERQGAQAFGGSIYQVSGDDIKTTHWDAFWAFYQDTGARKWGSPYLTRAFFDRLHQTMRDDLLLVLCERDGQLIAGALNIIGRDALFGRYWGCLENHRFLHFEVCYYQAIDFAIRTGLGRVEAGAQGEHKLARGYMPTPTYSLHWFADPGFRDAVETYLKAEKRAVGQEIEILTSYGPFKTQGSDT